MHHTLKTHPAMYHAVQSGTKTFEVRKDDRAFQCGDTVELTWFDPDMPGVQDPKPPLKFTIGFVLRGGQYGIEPGHVAFSLLPMPERHNEWIKHNGMSGMPDAARGHNLFGVHYKDGSKDNMTIWHAIDWSKVEEYKIIPETK